MLGPLLPYWRPPEYREHHAPAPFLVNDTLSHPTCTPLPLQPEPSVTFCEGLLCMNRWAKKRVCPYNLAMVTVSESRNYVTVIS